MSFKPPARRRSCLRSQNTIEVETSDGNGVAEKEDTATVSIPRKRVSFSHKNEIKEFQNVSADERDNSMCQEGPSVMDMTMQTGHHNLESGNCDFGVNENVMPTVDMSMTYTVQMGEGTFINANDSSMQTSAMHMTFSQEKSRVFENRQNQDATFVVENSLNRQDMSMSQFFLGCELPVEEQQQSELQLLLHEGERQPKNIISYNNVEQLRFHHIPDMSLTMTREESPLQLQPPTGFHDDIVENQEYIPVEEPHVPEISMMMESILLQNTIYPHHPNHTFTNTTNNNNNFTTDSNLNAPQNMNMSMTVDWGPSNINYQHCNSPQTQFETTVHDNLHDMSTTMYGETEPFAQLDRTKFCHHEDIDVDNSTEYTQFCPDISMTMDLETMSKLVHQDKIMSSTSTKTKDYPDMSMTTTAPIPTNTTEISSSLHPSVNQNPSHANVPNLLSFMKEEEEKVGERNQSDNRVGSKRRQTYTIVQGSQVNDYAFKPPIPTPSLLSYKVVRLPAKSTVPVPENSAFGRFGSAKTPKRKLLADIFPFVATTERTTSTKVSNEPVVALEQQILQQVDSTGVVNETKMVPNNVNSSYLAPTVMSESNEAVQGPSFDTTTATTCKMEIKPIGLLNNHQKSSAFNHYENSNINDISTNKNEEMEILKSTCTNINMNDETYYENQQFSDPMTIPSAIIANLGDMSCIVVSSAPQKQLINNDNCIKVSHSEVQHKNPWASIQLENKGQQQKDFQNIPAPLPTPVQNLLKASIETIKIPLATTNQIKEAKEKQCYSKMQRRVGPVNNCNDSKENKSMSTLESMLFHLKTLKGLPLQKSLINFSKYLQALEDAEFSLTITQITGFVNPNFIQAELKIREYEKILRTKDFPTNEMNPALAFSRRKLAEL